MGLIDQILDKGGGVVGTLTKKFGIDAGQAKAALEKIVPFIQDKVGGKLNIPGLGGVLASQIKGAGLAGLARDPASLAGDDAAAKGKALLGELGDDDQDTQVAEVSRLTGLDPAVVRDMMPVAAVATAGAMDADGMLDNFREQHDKILEILRQVAEDQKR
jgi:hypothetical protein